MRKLLLIFPLLFFAFFLKAQTVTITQTKGNPSCKGDTAQFVCTVENPPGTPITAEAFRWTIDGVDVPNNNNDTLISKELVNGKIIGCWATVAGTEYGGTSSSSLTITDVTTVDTGIEVSDDVICGTDAQLVLASQETGVTYSAWLSTSLGPISTTSNNPISYSEFAHGENKVVIKAKKGDCTFSMQDTAKVTNSGGKIDLKINGDTLCEAGTGNVTIKSSESGVTYESYFESTLVATGTGTGSDLKMPVEASKLQSGSNTLTFKIMSVTPACTVDMTNAAVVNVITAPSSDNTVSGDTLCTISGATVKIASTVSDYNYEATVVTAFDTIQGTGSEITFNVPSSQLKEGPNTISFRAFSGSCSTVITNKAVVYIGKPDSLQTVTGSNVCEGDSGTVTISTSETGVSYTAKIGETTVGTISGTGSNIIFKIENANLTDGTNTVKITATRSTCSSNLTDATIQYNKNPTESTVTGEKICGDIDPSVTISETTTDIKYYIVLDNEELASEIATGGELKITVTNSLLNEGDNLVNIKAENVTTSCYTIFSEQATLTVGAYPNVDLIMEDMDICSGEDDKITILDAESDVTYVLYKDAIATEDSLTGISILEYNITPTETAYYSVFAKQDNNCNKMLSDSALITVKICELDIPSGFSPNGDGINDVFLIGGIKSNPKTSLTILNRWGNKVFYARRYKNDWDGIGNAGVGDKNLPVGTYYYIIRKNDGSDPIKGQVYLAR